MKQVVLSLNNNTNLDLNHKGQKYFAYANRFKFFIIQDITEIFNFWNKFDYILLCNSYCIIKQLNSTTVNNFLNSPRYELLLGSIEHIPIYFDAFFIKSSVWSRIFLSDIIRKRLYLDDYINSFGLKPESVKQILIDNTFRSFDGKSGPMVYNSINESTTSCINSIRSTQQKIGLI